MCFHEMCGVWSLAFHKGKLSVRPQACQIKVHAFDPQARVIGSELEGRRWVRITSLGDRVLLLSRFSADCRAASAYFVCARKSLQRRLFVRNTLFDVSSSLVGVM